MSLFSKSREISHLRARDFRVSLAMVYLTPLNLGDTEGPYESGLPRKRGGKSWNLTEYWSLLSTRQRASVKTLVLDFS